MFRRVRAVGLLAVLTVVLGACDWPMFGFDAAQTRSSPDTSISLSAAASGSTAPAWSGITGLNDEVDGSPAIDHGVLYVGDANDRLFAFDATGTTNCAGTPKTCAPLWTGATGASTGVDVASPTVANDVVYIGSDNNKLYAFDAAGTTNCSGTPKTCAPLWTAATGGAVLSPPVVANGVVYVGSEDHKVYAFDAAGNTNCSGTPKTCTPLWTATTGGAIEANLAVANGILYVGSQALYAFDAAGNTNCSGTPKTCTQLWTGNTATPVVGIAVAGGMVYASAGSRSFPGGGVGVLYAFATKNCSSFQCSPLWKAGLADAPSAPAVANGVVYIGTFGGALYAFDAAGNTGCIPNSTRVCTPLWIGSTGPNSADSSPAVANGVVYIGGQTLTGDNLNQLLAFDASGTTNCSGAPKTCTPIYTSASTFALLFSSPAVANGYVYIGDAVPAAGRGGVVYGVAAFHFG